jgi:hypothetical protein
MCTKCRTIILQCCCLSGSPLRSCFYYILIYISKHTGYISLRVRGVCDCSGQFCRCRQFEAAECQFLALHSRFAVMKNCKDFVYVWGKFLFLFSISFVISWEYQNSFGSETCRVRRRHTVRQCEVWFLQFLTSQREAMDLKCAAT